MARAAKLLHFRVLIEQDEDGVYVASVPELPGCYTQGNTLEDARKRIREAIELVLATERDKTFRQHTDSTPRFFGVEDIQIRYA